ncbi:alcohol dehydrogenase [Aspergillus alliaceus]|uniref:alcohol dehydrogenase n=1 Tax=Petromyces alliaceus TaxID=209559 RepID=UPI0012A57E05|nr:alcohol dehydrogenase [Aspergillus alliaceus]KAB8239139.1 alcohol dehydrogenase [Aspergillus alliaceus]
MSRAMKALLLTKEPEASAPTLSLTNLPIPLATPGYGLIKVHFSVIQPSDKYNSIGGFPKTTFPRIPGRDYSGTVIDIAQGPSNAQLDQQNSHDGSHAQYCLIPEAMLAEKPKTLSLLQAATIGVPFTTAIRYLRRARIRTDDVVLVLGATGAVASAAVQVAKAMGCQHVLTASREESDKPDIWIGGDVMAEVQKQGPFLTEGKVGRGGRYAWIASPRGGSSTRLDLNIFRAYRKEIGLDTAEEMQTLTRWFDSGVISPGDESIFDIVGLDDAVERGYKAELGAKQVVIAMD